MTILSTEPRGTAALLVNAADQYLLHLRDANKGVDPGTWSIPGGDREGEETCRLAVERVLLAAVFGLPGAAWPLNTVGFVFDGGRLTAAQLEGIVLDPAEHDEVRALAVADWEPLMPGRDFTRLQAVVAARESGVPVYFEAWNWEK
ncbi:hypothetical protein ACFWP3_15385 [Streptomyces sp. NPDC058525]|uniref:hypothetical protein n=1 Tax=Streptomyces sp. NPDC058525 TaxID=3346538 RepID=UPI003666CF22